MRTNYFTSVILVGFAAILFFSLNSITKAQVDKARGVNWNNASALISKIENAVGTGDRKELNDRLNELKDNLT